MSITADARAALAAELERVLDDVPVLTETPSALVAPVAIVAESDPWITAEAEGTTWAESQVRWDVLVLVAPGPSASMTRALDGHVSALLEAWPRQVDVSGFVNLTHGQATYRAARVTITDYLPITT